MKRLQFILVIFLLSTILSAQAYRTQAVSDEIYTIEVNANGDWNSLPVVNLNSRDYIRIGFDRVSDNSYHRLRYKIKHCDATWKPSRELSEIDYLDGFNDNLIEDYNASLNTTVEYTHFNLRIPNADVALKLSGNYVVEVYEDDEPDSTLLTACFSVVDPQLNVGVSVSSNTDIDSNKNHQQLAITVNSDMNIRDPYSDIKLYVQQNNRIDSEKQLLKPTFIGGNKIVYERSRDLIFEAGNEYRRFELSSYRYNGMNIAHLEYTKPFYSMHVSDDNVRAGRSYSYDQDQNGRYIVRNKEADKHETEADYFITHFTLKVENPMLENIYLNGDFTDNTFTDKFKMKYDSEDGVYRLSLLLKQGLYNYQYLVQNGNRYSTAKIEGNYYETENEYTVYVYYRPTGQRYDGLAGLTTIYSRRK